MIIKRAKLLPTHLYSYHCGELAEILDVVMVQPSEQHKPRPCYLVRFPDGSKDYVAIEDTKNYEIVTDD